MSVLTVVMAAFALIGALDRIFGNRFGLGREFEKGFMLLGNLALSMIGMIVMAPFLAELMKPLLSFLSGTLHMEPSIIPASLFANDMGGAPLASAVAADEKLGTFNALVVSSMMGCTVSFTIPYALGAVDRAQHRPLLLGLLYGIVTLPAGCFAGGLVLGLPAGALVLDLLPLVLFSALIAAGLVLCPEKCVKVFSWVGTLIKILITVGLALGVLRFLTGVELIPGLATLEEGAAICLSAAAVMAGAFPLLHVLSRLLQRPMKSLGRRLGVGETAVMGFVATLASSITTFESMKQMDEKGVMLNAAFAVSAAFTFADHLAFTAAFDPACITGVIAGKLLSGVLALAAANLAWKHLKSAG